MVTEQVMETLQRIESKLDRLLNQPWPIAGCTWPAEDYNLHLKHPHLWAPKPQQEKD